MKIRIVLVPVLLMVFIVAGCGGGGGGDDVQAAPDPAPAPPPPPPIRELVVPADDTGGWPLAEVDDNMRAGLEAVLDAIEAGTYPTLDGLAIAHRGELVFDRTFRTTLDRFDDSVGNTEPRLHAQFSVTKSLAALLVGIAIDQGDLPAPLDVAYLDLFAGQAFENTDERKTAMTLHDVLAFRTGLDWNEFDPPYSSPDNQLNRFLLEEVDFTQALLDLPMAAEPGEVFRYITPATTTLGDVIERAQPLALEDYVGTYLLLPLGIERIEVFRTPLGMPDLGRGAFLLARDALKFGQLLIDRGRWNETQVVSEEWLARMLTPYSETSWQNPEQREWQLRGYGYQWWLGDIEVEGTLHDVHLAWGYGDQFLFVVPALELAVAVTGSGYSVSDDDDVLDMIGGDIVPLFAPD